MPAISGYRVSRLAISDAGFTPYLVGVNCNNIIFLNGGGSLVYLRTDDQDPNTELVLSGGMQLAITCPLSGAGERRSAMGQKPHRFMVGDCAGYFKSDGPANVGPIYGLEII
jgi:hypothetical protein